jgi:hypothetical protein
MYRNLFAVFATLALGTGAASATTATTQPSTQSLEQRVLAAQKTIDAAMGATQDTTAKEESNKVAQYYFRNYHPFYNAYVPPFRNFGNSYYGY